MKQRIISLFLIMTMITSLGTISNAQDAPDPLELNKSLKTQIFDVDSNEYIHADQLNKDTQNSLTKDIDTLQNQGILSFSDEFIASSNSDSTSITL